MRTETYPAVKTSLSLPELVGVIRAEGDNKTYMSGFRRLGTGLNPGSWGWYTPEDDPFASAHEFGKPDFSIGIGSPGWSALFYVWDRGDHRLFEAQRSVGVDGGPGKELIRRIHKRLTR